MRKSIEYGYYEESLPSPDNPEAPGSAGFRGEPGLDQGSPLNEWWRKQSEANPSPPISLINRENTGIFDQFRPVLAPDTT